MPSSIELNLGGAPSPRRQRSDDDGDAAPFRVVVLGDFSGRPSAERGPLAQRRAVRVDIDNFETVFARMAPLAEIAGLQDKAGEGLRIELETMEEFSADALLARLPAQTLARATASVSLPASAAPAPGDATGATDDTGATRATRATRAADTTEGVDADDPAALMQRLLGGSLPANAPALAAAAPSAAALAAGAPPAAGPDATIHRLIRQWIGTQDAAPAPAAPSHGSDEAAAALLRHVLRDPAWRHLECAWRAVDRFVRELDMADGEVRLELLDCRADELLADLAAGTGDPARAAITPVLEGDGRGCDLVVSLEEFGPGLPELSLLGGLAAAATAQGAVLLAGAAPALAAVATSEDARVRASDESRVWRALRESALAPHIGLTFPRLLARLPYGPRHDPVAAFPFDELADAAAGATHHHLLWRSAALDAALLLAQGHGQGGVETLVQIDDLPAFVDRTGDEPRLQAVAEVYLGERESGLLQAAGFVTLQSDRRVPKARVSGWRSIAQGGDAELRGSWRG